MKKTVYSINQTLNVFQRWMFAAVALALGACQDECERKFTYTRYEPVYMTTQEFKAGVKMEAPGEISSPGKIYIKDQYLFVNERNKGIHVINNSNPAAPQPVAFITIPANNDMAVYGNTLYADSKMDLVVIDISDPTRAEEVFRIENAFPDQAFTMPLRTTGVDGNRGIVVDWVASETREMSECQAQNMPMAGNGWFWTRTDMAFSSAAAPPPSGSVNQSGIGGSMARFTLYDRYLYTVDNTSLQLFDISYPNSPTAGVRVNLGWGIETIFPYKDKLFIGSQTGMHIYDNKNPAQPEHLSTFMHAQACDPVVVDDRYAYVTLRDGTACNSFTNQLDVVDISNLRSPRLVKTYPMGNPHGLGKDGNTLFICDGAHGLKVYNAADVQKIDKNQLTKATIHSYDVIPFNAVAIVTGEDGLYQYDYSDPKNLKLLSKLQIGK